MMLVVQILILFIAVALLVASAGWDLASYTIPNFFPAALIAAYIVFALVAPATSLGVKLEIVGWHFLAGLAGLSLGFALFAFGLIGGGDAKLLAAITLWLGLQPVANSLLVQFGFATALFGGVLAIILISLRQYPLPGFLLGQTWIMRLHNSKAGIPYGVALAAGAVITPLLAFGGQSSLQKIIATLSAA